MSVRVWYNNYLDGYNGTTVSVTPSSQQTLLPATNVLNEQITKVWRTGTSVAAEYVTFDLTLSVLADSAIIHAHNLIGTDSLIQLRGSTDNFAASNVLVGSFTWSSGPMLITFSSVSYRYWRFAFTKTSAGVTRDIGRLFLCLKSDFAEPPDYDGFADGMDARDVTLVTAGGQTYSESRPTGRNFSLSWSALQQVDKYLITDLRNTVKTTSSFFFQTDATGPTEMSGPFYVKLTKIPTAKVTSYDSDFRWETKLELQEQI